MLRCVLVAVSLAMAFGQPAPYYWNAKFDLINIAEDIVTSVDVHVDTYVGKSVMITTNANGGKMTQLTRNDNPDQQATYLFFDMNNNLECNAFPGPGFIVSPPDASKLPVAGPTVLGTVSCVHHRLILPGGIAIGMYVNNATGYPVMISNSANEGQIMMVREYNFDAPPAHVFDVPGDCPTSSESEVLARHMHSHPAAAFLMGADHARLFSESATLVHEHNAAVRLGLSDNGTHFLSLNQFATTPFEQFARTKLMEPISAADMPRQQGPFFTGKPSAKTIDRRNDGLVTSIRDQGNCGSCWSFATAAAIETNTAMKTNSTPEHLAPQSLIDCIPSTFDSNATITCKGCFGGWPASAMDYVSAHGIASEADYPYAAVNQRACSSVARDVKISKFQLIAHGDSDSIAAAVEQHGAVVAIIQTLQDFVFYDHGVYANPACRGETLNHAVTIVGFGEEADGTPYWIVKNSFGKAWGESGYFRMLRGKDVCGIENWGVVPVA